MKTSTFNRIFENARSVNIQSNEWWHSSNIYSLHPMLFCLFMNSPFFFIHYYISFAVYFFDTA